MTLTEAEQLSSVWIKLRDHYAERLVTLRAKNDNSMDELATANLRGEIRMVKQFLALATQAPMVALDD